MSTDRWAEINSEDYFDHEGDHVTPDDAVANAIRISDARARYRLKRDGSPNGTCSSCGRSLHEQEAARATALGALCSDCEAKANSATDQMERLRDSGVGATDRTAPTAGE